MLAMVSWGQRFRSSLAWSSWAASLAFPRDDLTYRPQQSSSFPLNWLPSVAAAFLGSEVKWGDWGSWACCMLGAESIAGGEVFRMAVGWELSP
jgi:hypothetical protein